MDGYRNPWLEGVPRSQIYVHKTNNLQTGSYT